VNLSKKYGDIQALKDINLEVEKGSILGILGPTGSGKTTLLKCIAGIEMPDSGEIYIGGELVTSVTKRVFVKPEMRSIGMVFQSYALWPHMNVYENVAFPLKIRGLPKAEIERRVKEVISIVGLEGLEKKYPHQLSGGQQQRVALARALVYEPKILLLDEPLSNIDAKLRLELRSWIKGLVRKLNITTLYITHDQAEALSIADRIAIINNGVIMQQGTPEELYRKPANLFVADFLGTSNILKGRVMGGHNKDQELHVSISGRLMITVKANVTDINDYIGKDIYISFKGEDIEINHKGNVDAAPNKINTYRGRIKDLLFEGPHIRVLLEIEDSGVEIKALISRERYEMFRDNNYIAITIDPHKIHIIQENR